MTDSNRTRLGYIEEATLGTTPAIVNPGTAWSTFRSARFTGEGLNFNISNISSNELRNDRQVPDLSQVGAVVGGNVDFEASFFQTRTFLGDHIAASFFSDWVNTPEFFNFTADTTIVDAGTTANTYQVASGGTAVVAGHLVRASGFSNAANNQLFRAASSTGTTVVGTALGLVAEAVPPAGARLKVVGAEGAVGDITATGTGLASTALNFTTLGLQVGQWIKVGSDVALNQFATLANNGWARVAAIAANALTLDHRPTGWAVDTGTGKAIRIWFGDVLRNGTTRRSFTFEKGFLAQAVPTYAMYRGLVVNTLAFNIAAGEMVTGSFNYMGLSHSTSGSPFGTPAAPTLSEIYNATSNVGRIAEAGNAVVGPNFIRSLSVQINNNLRDNTGVGTLGLVNIGAGRFEASGSMMTYFGSTALYDKYVANSNTSVAVVQEKNNQGLVYTIPRAKFESGSIVARGRDQDVMVDLGYRAILDPTTNATMQIDRVEEFR